MLNLSSGFTIAIRLMLTGEITYLESATDFQTLLSQARYAAAICVRDNFPYQHRQFYLTTAQWMPAFKPDAAALFVIGDGAVKINQAIPGYFNKDNLEDLTGIELSGIPIPQVVNGNE